MLLDEVRAVLERALEERFNIAVADDKMGAAAFKALDLLTRFVESKLAG